MDQWNLGYFEDEKWRLLLPNVVDLQLMSVDDVHLLENVVNVPDFDGTIDGRGDYIVPVAHSQSL